MAKTREPVSPDGEPLYFDGLHNTWFENHHALTSGSVANAYRLNLASSAPFILSDLLPTTLRRSNAKKEKNTNSGQFGTAGVSGVSKRGHVEKRQAATIGTAGVSGVHRKNAVKEKHPNAGEFGTAGVSKVQRSNAVKKENPKAGKSRQPRRKSAQTTEGLGSFLDSDGSRRSSRVAKTSPETSPAFDQFEDPPM